MPADKPFKQLIPIIYRRKMEDQALFFFVQGVMTSLPAVTERDAIRMFLRRHGFSENCWPLTSAIQNYVVFKKDFLNSGDYKCRN